MQFLFLLLHNTGTVFKFYSKSTFSPRISSLAILLAAHAHCRVFYIIFCYDCILNWTVQRQFHGMLEFCCLSSLPKVRTESTKTSWIINSSHFELAKYIIHNLLKFHLLHIFHNILTTKMYSRRKKTRPVFDRALLLNPLGQEPQLFRGYCCGP